MHLAASLAAAAAFPRPEKLSAFTVLPRVFCLNVRLRLGDPVERVGSLHDGSDFPMVQHRP
jgi:hypothetical protein